MHEIHNNEDEDETGHVWSHEPGVMFRIWSRPQGSNFIFVFECWITSIDTGQTTKTKIYGGGPPIDQYGEIDYDFIAKLIHNFKRFIN